MLFSILADALETVAGEKRLRDSVGPEGALRGGLLSAMTEVFDCAIGHGASEVDCEDAGSETTALRASTEAVLLARCEARVLARATEALAAPEFCAALDGATSMPDSLRAQVAVVRAAAWPADDALNASDRTSCGAFDAAAVRLGVRAGVALLAEPSVSLALATESRRSNGWRGRPGSAGPAPGSAPGSAIFSFAHRQHVLSTLSELQSDSSLASTARSSYSGLSKTSASSATGTRCDADGATVDDGPEDGLISCGGMSALTVTRTPLLPSAFLSPTRSPQSPQSPAFASLMSLSGVDGLALLNATLRMESMPPPPYMAPSIASTPSTLSSLSMQPGAVGAAAAAATCSGDGPSVLPVTASPLRKRVRDAPV